MMITIIFVLIQLLINGYVKVNDKHPTNECFNLHDDKISDFVIKYL